MKKLLILAMVLAALLIAVPVSAAPGALHVDDDGLCGGNAPCYTTIQDAIDAASPKGVIHVHPGDYYGPIEIDKEGIKLMSTDGPSVTTIHQGSWPFYTGPGQYVWWWYVGIAILTDDVTVKGFKVTDDMDPSYGIHFNSPGIIAGDHRGPIGGDGYTPTFQQPVKNCMIQGNVLEHNAQGIYLFNAQDCMVVNNVVKNQERDDHIGQGGDGIILWDDSYLNLGNVGNKIINNEVFDNEHAGMFIGTWNPPRTANCDGTKVHGNSIYDNGGNLWVTYAIGIIRITGNDLHGTQPWIYMSPDVFVKGNK